MITKTLRIKRVFFNAIKDGSKKFEYRADKEYYEWLNTIEKPFKLILHYQGQEKLAVTVTNTRRIKTPKTIDREIIPTDRCWRLSLENPDLLPAK